MGCATVAGVDSAVIGLLDIRKPESAALVETWKQKGMPGVRLFLATPQAASMLADGSANWFWAAAEKADIAVMVHAGGGLPAMAAIAESHPGLRLCIDSLGTAPRMSDADAVERAVSASQSAPVPSSDF